MLLVKKSAQNMSKKCSKLVFFWEACRFASNGKWGTLFFGGVNPNASKGACTSALATLATSGCVYAVRVVYNNWLVDFDR